MLRSSSSGDSEVQKAVAQVCFPSFTSQSSLTGDIADLCSAWKNFAITPTSSHTSLTSSSTNTMSSTRTVRLLVSCSKIRSSAKICPNPARAREKGRRWPM